MIKDDSIRSTFADNPYTVTCHTESHWSVLTQTHGSKWPEVLPYCCFNVGVMILLSAASQWLHPDGPIIKLSTQGHTFLTMVVSFLLVSRVTTALNRYSQARDALGVMCTEMRDLIQHACVFSHKDQSVAAQEWRHQVAYRALVLLRLAMAVVDYPDTSVPAWTIPELNGIERQDVEENLFSTSSTARRWAHHERSEWEETLRVPGRLAFLLRKSIQSQADCLETPIKDYHFLFNSVSGFLKGYGAMRKFLTTPVPFPLIQMSRTFLFLYVFTLPLVLLQDDKSSNLAHCFIVFLLTYGFMGLEVVAIELDNPFGSDENDYASTLLAETAYEDCYLYVLDVDGPEWADKLRLRMHDETKQIRDDCPSEHSWLLGKMV